MLFDDMHVKDVLKFQKELGHIKPTQKELLKAWEIVVHACKVQHMIGKPTRDEQGPLPTAYHLVTNALRREKFKRIW